MRDITAIGEILIDLTQTGVSGAGVPLFAANPGGAPCNVLAMLQKLGKATAFVGKVGEDMFGRLLRSQLVRPGDTPRAVGSGTRAAPLGIERGPLARRVAPVVPPLGADGGGKLAPKPHGACGGFPRPPPARSSSNTRSAPGAAPPYQCPFCPNRFDCNFVFA